MKLKDAAEVINHMPANKAADLLLVLKNQLAINILSYVKPDHAEKIKTLLHYPEHTVGAFMTTDYLDVAKNKTIEAILSEIRHLKSLPDFIFYIYVIESDINNRLVGLISNYEMFKHDSRARIESIMIKNPITITADEPLEAALKKMYRYNLSALPVISAKEGRLLGIITFRDTVSYYLPRKWKTHIHQILYNNTQ